MESTRQAKVGRLIQKDISAIIQRISKEIFSGTLITVTRVKVTPDLMMARVNLSVFGKTPKEAVIAHFISIKSEVRFELGRMVKNQLRCIPTLEFYIDDSLDYIDNIDRLLKS
ncbi:MAG: ribosome-binding factor A [Bacteroidota bacterium]